MKSYLFDMNNVFCIATEASKKIVVFDEDFTSKNVVLYYLCKRIVDLENAGYLVCGVTELNPDGSHPKVAFRNTKEYRRAKKEYKL